VTCWRCQAVVDAGAATCASCGAVQPVHAATPFQRLALPESYELDDKAIERAWLTKSRAVHPDRFAKATDQERRYAAEQTAALNDAFRAIKDPFDRAILFARDHIPKLDQALLVELMEKRERAEEGDKQSVVDESVAQFRVLEKDVSAAFVAKDMTRVGRDLAEMKTLARLVADLGGPKLIASLDER
jgi:DnaJ-domain-containing protein 1